MLLQYTWLFAVTQPLRCAACFSTLFQFPSLFAETAVLSFAAVVTCSLSVNRSIRVFFIAVFLNSLPTGIWKGIENGLRFAYTHGI